MPAWRDYLLTLRMSARFFIQLNRNRLKRREFVPHPRTFLFIETVTHCNLGCKFCTHRLHRRPDAVMPLNTFRNYVDQAVGLGFDRIALTPINGDIFVDKGIMDKVELLERRDGITGMLAYSNFIAAGPAAIATLVALERLELFNISVYGFDPASFAAIADRGEAQYHRLVANLNHLADLLPTARRPQAFQATIRAARDFTLDQAPDSTLVVALRRLQGLGMAMSVQSRCDDWGGLIAPEDLAGLGMDLIRGRLLYKQGACILPFYSVQVLADGRVNACACRDVDGQLQIGDLRHQSLKQILSARNPVYTDLIRGQQAGHFADVCRGCSFYRSIHDVSIKDASPKGAWSLAQFWDFIDQD
jgi:MoaA/NifB/PqqE/SkfB family radical SAM enzyme